MYDAESASRFKSPPSSVLMDSNRINLSLAHIDNELSGKTNLGSDRINLPNSVEKENRIVSLNSTLCKQSKASYNIMKDSLYAPKCICLISQQPFNRTFRKILVNLFQMVEQHDLLGLSLESHLYNLIYQMPMPIDGKLLRFHVGCRPVDVYMPDYSNGRELPLLDYDLFEFFRLLGIQNAVNLFMATLLEHQILLYSHDYNLLMLVSECLTSLLFPFTWLKPYVPLVPASNLHFVDAPVPYIMGFHSPNIDKEALKQTQRCFVDIDAGTVSFPEDLPDFPLRNRFINEISDLIVRFGAKKATAFQTDLERTQTTAADEVLKNSQAYSRIAELAYKAGAFSTCESKLIMPLVASKAAKTAELSNDELIQIKFAQCVRELFLQKFVEMFASYEKYVIIPSLSSEQIDTWWKSREYAGNFDSKMFLIEQPSQFLPFLTHFLPSQMFVSFIDLKIISLIDASKSPDPAVRIFDERIKQYKEANTNDLRPSCMLNVDEIEEEVLRKWSQEPLLAPKVRQRVENSSKSSNEHKPKRLFEHLDQDALREDPDQIELMFKQIQQRKQSLVEKREQFSSSRLISFDKTVWAF